MFYFLTGHIRHLLKMSNILCTQKYDILIFPCEGESTLSFMILFKKILTVIIIVKSMQFFIK